MNRRTALVGMATATATATAAGASTATPSHSSAASTVKHKIHNREAGASYCQAREVGDFKRLLFVSGQIPVDQSGKVPPGFKDQARVVWANIATQLRAAGMTLDDLVKVTIFLSDRRYRKENYEVRHEVLGERSPALTIIITGIYDEAWLLEIEAMAAA